MNWWSRLLGAGAAASGEGSRWIVLDVESTGLDTQSDHLLAIAAVAVAFDGERAPRIALADSFEAVVHHRGASTDKDNILLHGIGVGEQRAGVPAAEMLTAFEHWAGAAPRVAFHAAFDQAMIGRAMKASLGRAGTGAWLDLAPVASALHPEVDALALDDWLAHFGIECAVRHQAAADTLATAELLLRLWPAARAQGSASFKGLARLARQQRWLAKG
jgi:DNA polymerase-3 subunit epsilon